MLWQEPSRRPRMMHSLATLVPDEPGAPVVTVLRIGGDVDAADQGPLDRLLLGDAVSPLGLGLLGHSRWLPCLVCERRRSTVPHLCSLTTGGIT